ncbi:unnamed protein product [Acanthocheilonema viteae]|uniref:Uncharacterized protein n=1 Tax=Acanthocheilonema viteae TaxID=6277 RepID=A0A498SPZ4_ACAVI|nr:unnamed protein product [Acanthocheilonema viteae]
MSTTVNKTTAVVGSTDFDEETWLVEPPNLPTQSNSTQESGRIAEWLQGAAMNVDFQTRSALSRKLASQAARKKKRAEKLREKTGSMNEHRRENMAQVKEELIEVNQSYGDNDNEKDTENEGIVPNSNDNSILVVDKKLSKQHSKISYEQQQHGVSGATVPPVLSLLPTGNMTIISDNIDDGGDDDDDDDENDEFYDASSDFNDLPFSSTAANTLIDNANISSAVASQNGKII